MSWTLWLVPIPAAVVGIAFGIAAMNRAGRRTYHRLKLLFECCPDRDWAVMDELMPLMGRSMIYGALLRLENEGLIETVWELPDERGLPVRVLYRAKDRRANVWAR